MLRSMVPETKKGEDRARMRLGKSQELDRLVMQPQLMWIRCRNSAKGRLKFILPWLDFVSDLADVINPLFVGLMVIVEGCQPRKVATIDSI